VWSDSIGTSNPPSQGYGGQALLRKAPAGELSNSGRGAETLAVVTFVALESPASRCRAALRVRCYESGPAQKRSCIPGLLRYFPRSFMAKTSWINRNNRKRATVKKYAALRAELKAKKDYQGLSQLPRDASPTRVVNRCEVSGRRRAFIRRFKISRLTFRELASAGFIPGVTKSSW
jgi:small subunit ribosomal protein S14